MSQYTTEPYLGENAWLYDVKPRLTCVKESLTKGLTIYGYKEDDTNESSTTYHFGKDAIYCTTQTKPLNTAVVGERRLSDTETERNLVSQKNNVPITKLAWSFRNKSSALYFIKDTNGEIKDWKLRYIGYLNPRNKVYSSHVSVISDDAIKNKILTINHNEETILHDEANELLGADFIRKERSNAIQIHRRNQREKRYKVVQKDLNACAQLQQEIEDLIKKRAEEEFLTLCTKLQNDNERCVHPKIKNAVSKLLQKILDMEKFNPESRPKLLEVLERLESLLDPKENPTCSTTNFTNFAQTLSGSGNKELEVVGANMLTLSYLLTIYAISIFILVIIVTASIAPSCLTIGYMATHLGLLSDGLMCGLTCTGSIPAAMGAAVTGVIGLSLFAASRPTGLPKLLLDVCDAVEKDTKLISSNIQSVKI